jgi:PAS domain S-box-containing protein
VKTNLPVTNREVELQEGQTIVTKTDMKGLIIYANDDFCQISGFAIQELIGKNHNVVRHPDMPQEAFEDLWRTVQSGKPWSGLVKNRAKNGDFYWVKAFVAPVHDQQTIVGYVSSRIKPSREEIAVTEKLYEDMRESKSAFILREGILIPRSILRQANPLFLLSRMTVGIQLALLSFVFLAGSLLAGALTFVTLEHVKVNGPIYNRVAQSKDLVADILPPPEYLLESWMNTLEMTKAKQDALPKLIEKSKILRNDYESRHEFWNKELENGEMKTVLIEDSYRPAKVFLDSLDNQMIPALKAGDQNRVEQLLPILRMNYEAHRTQIDKVVNIANAKVDNDQNYANGEIKQKYLVLLIMYASYFVVGGLSAALITRHLIKQLGGEPKYASDIAQQIAAGNLGMYVKNEKNDSTSLLYALKQMQEKLQKTISKVQADAETVAVVASQLAESSMQVKTASTDQSELATNIASISEEMTSSVASVAENTIQAKKLSDSSEAVCIQGTNVIHNAVQSMERIAEDTNATAITMSRLGEQSIQVATIVNTIREIADQTNLLALNAAIEAARAGDQGRGFSVVADEVRKLAERTMSSTQDIAKVISEIQTGMKNAASAMETGVLRVNEGTSLASEAGTAIEEIKQSANSVVKVIAQISQAMDEQKKASQEVSSHIERIAGMSETNSKFAEESASAAFQLKISAKNLSYSINRFAI